MTPQTRLLVDFIPTILSDKLFLYKIKTPPAGRPLNNSVVVSLPANMTLYSFKYCHFILCVNLYCKL